MNPRKTTKAQVLQAARALVAQGWIQRWYCSRASTGRWNYCVLGALNAASVGVSDRLVLAAYQSLVAHLPCGFECLDDFNDHPRTTQRRVLALFDRTLIEVTKSATHD